MIRETRIPSHADPVLATAKWLVLIANALFMVSFFAWFSFHIWSDSSWLIELAKNHYPAVVGLPFAAAGALGVVILVEMTHGEIEFNALGFSFKGTAGQAILWLRAFSE